MTSRVLARDWCVLLAMVAVLAACSLQDSRTGKSPPSGQESMVSRDKGAAREMPSFIDATCITGYSYTPDPETPTIRLGPTWILTGALEDPDRGQQSASVQTKLPVAVAAGHTAIITAENASGQVLTIEQSGRSGSALRVSATCSDTAKVWPAGLTMPTRGCVTVTATEDGQSWHAALPAVPGNAC